jgi:hypothetical protein
VTGPRSFTVRVPYEVYLNICDQAQLEGKKLNTKVNELISLGLGKTLELNDMLRAMLVEQLNKEERS